MAAIPSIASADEAERPEGAARTGSRAWPRWEVAVVAAAAVVGLALRLHGYGRAPAFTDNLDELQFAWAGLNLIMHGDAYTWAFHGYPSYAPGPHVYGIRFPMVHHWMDHPPLFALLMGGWVWLLGVRDMVAVTPGQVRVPPI